MSESVRVSVRVTGRVQGVFYRGSKQAEAERLGLVGWVRNLADGSVQLEAQGPRAAVDALLAWCRVGPCGARVDDVVTRVVETDAHASGFQIRT